jgi:putative endonuclease
MQKAHLLRTLCDVRDAIARESQLKKWSRSKKIELVNRLNPRWDDLGADVLQDR